MSSALAGSFQGLRSIRIDGIANLFFGRLSTRLRSEMSSDPLHTRSTTDNGSFMFYSAFLPCGVASLLLPAGGRSLHYELSIPARTGLVTTGWRAYTKGETR